MGLPLPDQALPAVLVLYYVLRHVRSLTLTCPQVVIANCFQPEPSNEIPSYTQGMANPRRFDSARPVFVIIPALCNNV